VAKAYNRQEKQLHNLQSKASETRSAAAGTFNNDPFGGGASGLMLQLKADTNDARAMTAALRTLKRKHISSGLAAALAASGDLDTAQQLAKMSGGKINQFDAAFAARAQAQQTLGNTAANVAFGTQMRRLNQVLSHLDRRIEGIERAPSEAPARASPSVTRRPSTSAAHTEGATSDVPPRAHRLRA
jgi:hypothetical protein